MEDPDVVGVLTEPSDVCSIGSAGAVGFGTPESEHDAMTKAPRIAGSERSTDRITGTRVRVAEATTPLRQPLCPVLTRYVSGVYKNLPGQAHL